MTTVQEPPKTELHFIPTHELSKRQFDYAQVQRERLARTVPNIPIPEQYDSWTLLRGDEPIGTFSAVPYLFFGSTVFEVGLRVWSPSREVLDAGRDFMFHYLNISPRLVGRVFPDNKAVKKLVQLLGFRLTGYDYDQDGRVVEVYEIERGQLVGPRPKSITGANKKETFPLGAASR